MDVDKLLEVGVNMADISKLKSAGITTIKGVQMVTSKNLQRIKGFSEQRVIKIKEATQKLIQNGFITGTEVQNRRKHIIKITTGCPEFDSLLGGGLQTMSISEAFGEFRTGKTQYLTLKLDWAILYVVLCNYQLKWAEEMEKQSTCNYL